MHAADTVYVEPISNAATSYRFLWRSGRGGGGGGGGGGGEVAPPPPPPPLNLGINMCSSGQPKLTPEFESQSHP